MVVVIDFDGTLALGDTKDITSMGPNARIINLVNNMYLDGNYIKIVTARGSQSCNSYQEKYDKYYNVISEWLKTNKVLYHEISFNKEYGDVYLDDRSIDIEKEIHYLKLDSQFTENKVRKINNIVVKKCKNVAESIEWYKIASFYNLNVPKILSYDATTITTNFIKGKRCENFELIYPLIKKFSTIEPSNHATFKSYIERIKSHGSKNSLIKNIDKLVSHLNEVSIPNTFNHGDFSVDNSIESNNILYLIDPNHSKELFQSYVLDIAKHLFSILYYTQNTDLYNLFMKEYISRFNLNPYYLQVLVASESVRVSTYRKQMSEISNNLIQQL